MDQPKGTKNSQFQRLLVAAGYLVALAVLSIVLLATPLPSFGLHGIWFYAGFAALIVGDYLVEPFFARPADAIANGVALLLVTASASSEGAAVDEPTWWVGRAVLFVYGASVVVLGVVAISAKDRPGRAGRVAAAASRVVRRIGRARTLFSVLLFAAGYAVFADDASRLAVLYLAWFVILVGRPLEEIARNLEGRRPARTNDPTAIVERIEDPWIVLGRVAPNRSVSLGSLATEVGGGAIGTVVDMTKTAEEALVRIALAEARVVPIGTRFRFDEPPAGDDLVGYVGDGTTIDEAQVRTIPSAADAGLAEARLLSIAVGDSKALYQVTGGETFGRSENEMHRSLVRVSARKLGTWSENQGTFEPVEWLPAPGTPVHLLTAPATVFDERFIGHVPGTRYGLSVDLHSLVTHNTAILGILGAGKTHLAWELIARMLVERIKVVCLDISGRYSDHFRRTCPPEVQQRIENRIDAAIDANYGNAVVRNNEAGNIQDFSTAIEQLVTAFLNGPERLLVVNPNHFHVSRMRGNPFQGRANMMMDLTMVEVTRIVAETLLQFMQQADRDPRDESARLCLVLEEAHSLVPEWNSAASDQDQQAVNGTARAILQGRKYGFGCLLVTQRTANVTKSILNQCNTIFGMRAYDATGMGFLENYIGPTHARLLASLRDRQAVVFGRASSCQSPLIIQINDAADFEAAWWADHVAAVTPTTGEVPQPDATVVEAPHET